MTEVEDVGPPSSDAPQEPTAAARSEEPEQRAPDNREQKPETENRTPEPQKCAPETEERAPDTQERAPEPERRSTPESQDVPQSETEARPSVMLTVPAPVDPAVLQYKLRKFFVLRVKHFHFPFTKKGTYCHAKPHVTL